ncbi:Crp/Fnr family transcriptional regulator [Paracoccus cavernae]
MAISDYFIRYLQGKSEVGPADIARLRSIRTTTTSFQPGAVIIPQGETLTRSSMMVRGMSAHAHKVQGRSDVQVITAIHIIGDFTDLHGFMTKRLEHDVISMGQSSVEFIAHDELSRITQEFPHLTRLLWLATTFDAAVHRRWLVAAASLRSSAHLAHLVCELYTRQRSIGATQGLRFTLPILQRELAEILGYSPIHINRAVRDLKDRGLVRWVGSEVQILDWDELCRLAKFDPDYLSMERLVH